MVMLADTLEWPNRRYINGESTNPAVEVVLGAALAFGPLGEVALSQLPLQVRHHHHPPSRTRTCTCTHARAHTTTHARAHTRSHTRARTLARAISPRTCACAQRPLGVQPCSPQLSAAWSGAGDADERLCQAPRVLLQRPKCASLPSRQSPYRMQRIYLLRGIPLRAPSAYRRRSG